MKNDILRIALPSIVTNITVPLLGIVDLAIVGHIPTNSPDTQYTVTAASIIGAVAVGTLIFNMVYWLFNFLRMGSSGLTAQAYGRKDRLSQQRILRMGLTIALSCGVLLIALQSPIIWMAHAIIAPSDDVWGLAVRYFRIRIWAAPAVLSLFAMNGWLVGMQNSRFPMYIAIGQNLVNIIVSYFLVFHLGLGIEGVALGTVISQYAGLLAACCLCYQQDKLSTKLSTIPVDNANTNTCQQQNVDKNGGKEESYQQPDVQIEWKTFFTVNRDIFFRMICLIAVTTAFTAYGARMSDTLLAVNTLLMQLFTLFSYFSDGFALAGEALVGKAIGEKAPCRPLISRLFNWGWCVAGLFTLVYIVAGPYLLQIFTPDNTVLNAALPYLPWACAIPCCGIAAFMWDGIYIGATRTRQMFLSLLISAIVFFALFEAGKRIIVSPADTNHLLWAAFLSYLFVRGIVLHHYSYLIKSE